MMKDKVLSGSPTEQEYQAKRAATQINLRKYYNRCVAVMAKEEAGEITIDEALDTMLMIDAEWAKIIVDDIAPKKHLLET